MSLTRFLLITLLIAPSIYAQQPPRGAFSMDDYWIAFFHHEDAFARYVSSLASRPRLHDAELKRHADTLGLESAEVLKIGPVAAALKGDLNSVQLSDPASFTLQRAETVARAKSALQKTLKPASIMALNTYFGRSFYTGPRPK